MDRHITTLLLCCVSQLKKLTHKFISFQLTIILLTFNLFTYYTFLVFKLFTSGRSFGPTYVIFGYEMK